MARKSRKNRSADISKIKKYKTAVYARISGESQGEESIDSQIEYVKNYISSNKEFELVDVYADEGCTGTNFNRPEFKRLMEDLRSGKVDCIVVKDLSRFAREHIGAGDYLNNIFPFLGVRFIAIMDSYDNLNIKPEEYFIASFKNLAHAHFAAETSQKISATVRTMQDEGRYIGRACAYGYAHDPKDYHRLIIVEEQAAVIREIFERVAKGEKPNDVRIDLNRRKVLVPEWSSQRMRDTLKNEYYKGTLVLRRTVKALYKGEKKRHIPKDQQLRFENSDRVPVIVEPEIWQKVQDIVASRRRKTDLKSKYEGLVYCGSCGAYITPRYKRDSDAFQFYCEKCKFVYVFDRVIDKAIRDHLKLTQDEDITESILHRCFKKIILVGKKQFSFQNSDVR